jgi:Rieske Fe-S protein
MATCEVCGNEYDKAFTVEAAGARHTFDSFECAIQAMVPICEHCQCRVIGTELKLRVTSFAALTAGGLRHQQMSGSSGLVSAQSAPAISIRRCSAYSNRRSYSHVHCTRHRDQFDLRKEL